MNTLDFEKLATDIVGRLSVSAPTLSDANRKLLTSSVQRILAGMDLVTREEFDIQAEVLQRAIQRVSELEDRVAKLEGH